MKARSNLSARLIYCAHREKSPQGRSSTRDDDDDHRLRKPVVVECRPHESQVISLLA